MRPENALCPQCGRTGMVITEQARIFDPDGNVRHYDNRLECRACKHIAWAISTRSRPDALMLGLEPF